METKIKAIFKGQNGSCGYTTNKEYTLNLNHLNRGKGLITINNSKNEGYCEYGSMNAFLKNWDNIRNN